MESKNVEINFYGKVVDQNDQPLTGAAVQSQTREWFMKNPFEPGGKFVRPVAVTGADGLFSFTRLRGDSFQILSIAKDGYKLTTKAKSGYSYGPLKHHYVPDALNPVVQETALAEEALRASLTLMRDIGHVRVVPSALCNLGHVLAAAGRAHEARSALLEAQALAREQNDAALVDECEAALHALPPEPAAEPTSLQVNRD